MTLIRRADTLALVTKPSPVTRPKLRTMHSQCTNKPLMRLNNRQQWSKPRQRPNSQRNRFTSSKRRSKSDPLITVAIVCSVFSLPAFGCPAGLAHALDAAANILAVRKLSISIRTRHEKHAHHTPDIPMMSVAITLPPTALNHTQHRITCVK